MTAREAANRLFDKFCCRLLENVCRDEFVADAMPVVNAALAFQQAELARLRERVETLQAQKAYYESVLTCDTSKLWAIENHPDDPVKAVEHERVVDIVRERDELRERVAELEEEIRHRED